MEVYHGLTLTQNHDLIPRNLTHRTHVSRTPNKPEYLIALSRNLLRAGVRWDSVPFNFFNGLIHEVVRSQIFGLHRSMTPCCVAPKFLSPDPPADTQYQHIQESPVDTTLLSTIMYTRQSIYMIILPSWKVTCFLAV